MQIWNYASHMTSAKQCVCTYTGVLTKNEVTSQAFPNVRDLLSVKDKQEVKNFQSDFAVVYISGKGHRQWPSVAESTVLFITRCVGKAREEFIRQLADLRRRQRIAQQEDAQAAREAARQAAKRDKGQDTQQVDTEGDAPKKRKKDKLRYWAGPFKWDKTTRGGPPLERLLPIMSTVDILTVSVFGGAADAEKLWPEFEEIGQWSDAGEPARWEDIWKQRNKRPHDLWITQGVGEGLPILGCL